METRASLIPFCPGLVLVFSQYSSLRTRCFRIFNSLEVSDFPNNFNHHSKAKDVPVVYNNPLVDRRQDNSNDHLGISHEHTDSGLGTEQDCIYNSEKYDFLYVRC
jgi:hypothetical protein